MNTKIERTDAGERLLISGEMSIERVSDLKDILVRVLENSTHVTVCLSDVERIDTACLQLFCSAHRTALNAGKTLAFSANTPETVEREIRDSGYFRKTGCACNGDNKCLWLEES